MEKCCECDKAFSTLYNLRKHAKKFHPDKVNDVAPKKKFAYQCEPCKRNFNHLKDFIYHKKIHSAEKDIRKSTAKLKCALCQFNATKAELLVHFETDHDVQIKTDIFDFNSSEEFIDWKNKLEDSTRAKFVKQTGKFCNSKNKSIIKYVCHRSGNYTSKGQGLRRLKTQGSNKINGFCPACIKVEVKNNKYRVSLISQHVGHQHDLRHLSLTSEEREKLANQMALKIPFKEILDQVQDSVQDSELKRIHLLTKRDLYNIEKSFNSQSNVTEHQNDEIHVEALEIKMESNGCVSFYEGQGMESIDHKELKKDDFIIIITNSDQEGVPKKYLKYCVSLESTHGLNQYRLDHILTGLDGCNSGMPEAEAADKTKLAEEKEKIITNLIPNLIKVVENISCMEQVDEFKKLCAPIAPTLSAIASRHEDFKKPVPSDNLFGPHNERIILSTKKNNKNKAASLAAPTIKEEKEEDITGLDSDNYLVVIEP